MLLRAQGQMLAVSFCRIQHPGTAGEDLRIGLKITDQLRPQCSENLWIFQFPDFTPKTF